MSEGWYNGSMVCLILDIKGDLVLVGQRVVIVSQCLNNRMEETMFALTLP